MRKFSPEVKKILSNSKIEAKRMGQGFAGPEHILLGIIKEEDSLATKVFESLDVDLDELADYLEKYSSNQRTGSGMPHRDIPFDKHAEKVLKFSFVEVKGYKKWELCP